MPNSDSYQDKVLLRPREAARILAVSERKLWSMTFEDSSIPFVRCGRLVRYPVDGLKSWVASHVEGGDSNDDT